MDHLKEIYWRKLMNKKVNKNNLKRLVEVDWKLLSDRNAISKTYKFKNFNEAFAFMTSAAMFADKINHHPEWFNVYNRITVDLTTHEAGGVTNNDINLAKILNSLL